MFERQHATAQNATEDVPVEEAGGTVPADTRQEAGGATQAEARRDDGEETLRHPKFGWIDVLWLAFLGGLAALPPVGEIHKQLTLIAIGLFQIFEGRLIAWRPGRGRIYSVLIKILLATLLIGHTGGVSINSDYYPIFYVPVVTAAIYFGPLATLGWTALASLAYCSYLIQAVLIEDYEVSPAGLGILAARILFFFLAALLVNRFVMENRRQVERQRALSATLEESNQKLRQAQADVRRAERLAALGQLSAGLAHEIRNPLGIIKGSAEMLSQKLETAQPVAGELAGFISTEVNRLNGLVSRFLDFARPSHLALSSVNLPAIVERALESAHNRYPNANVVVVRRFAESLPQVLADEQLCEQVFVNLILNAYEAMGAQEENAAAEKRGGTLTVSILPEWHHGISGVATKIEDSGPGIAEEIREQVFNPFVTSKKTGVGLGLSIVAKIVDDHGGSIQLKSKPGQGACFWVFLPAAKQ
ncbi:MAG TPA: ATP-binding protein [Candidatus Acidoferrales bacterium]|nr:ATP-binding protein [Candidatus Acidoferrales bacterium]